MLPLVVKNLLQRGAYFMHLYECQRAQIIGKIMLPKALRKFNSLKLYSF